MAHRLVLPALTFATLAGCSSITETRTRQVLDTQSIRLSEQRRVEEKPMVSVLRVGASELELGARMNERCLVQFGEREVVRESVVRAPNRNLLGLGAVGIGVGTGTALYSVSSSRDSDTLTTMDYVGLGGIAVAVASGVYLAVDAKRATRSEVVRKFQTTDREERLAPCSEPPPVPGRIELRTDDGRRFVSSIDGSGVARFRLPADFWKAGPRVEVSVRVDGRPGPGLVLERPAP